MTTAAQSVTNLNLLDRLRMTLPDGSIDMHVVKLLTQRNPILADMVVKQGNQDSGHLFTSDVALPTIGWRKINQGVAYSKGKTGQVTESCGMVDGWCRVDKALCDINGDGAAFRASQDDRFLQAFNNEISTGVFYHSTLSNPEKFMGLSPRFASTTASGGSQIILADSGASGADQTSAWLIGWGDDTVYGITPKGNPSGLSSDDFGLLPVLDGSSNPYPAYQTHWSWKFGFAVQDWRYVARVANIDTGNLTASGSTGSNLIQSMIKADHKIFEKETVRLAWYVNRTVSTYLHLQAQYASTNSTLKVEEIGGKPILTFLGVPVRETDAITITESAIS